MRLTNSRMSSIDFHPLCLDHGAGVGAYQECQEGADRLRLGRVLVDARGHDGIVLQLIGQRARKCSAGLADDLADLRDAERTVPFGKRRFRNIAASSEFRLRFELVGDAQLFDDAGDVNTGGTASRRIGIEYDPGVEQRAS